MKCLFVYGSLLSGEPNHGLLSRARFLMEAETEAGFELRDLGEYPGLVQGGSQAVIGEVYEVDAELLALLDEFEDHPTFYCRTNIVLAGGVAAETYLLRAEQVQDCPRVESGNWRAWRSTRAVREFP